MNALELEQQRQAERLGAILGLFAEQGKHGGYGQQQLAREMCLTPQALRRRGKEAKEGQAPRAMPIAQLHQLAKIAVREIRILRGYDWQEVAAFLQALDRLLPRPLRFDGSTCPDEGRCHGCVCWCDVCGDVRMLCDDPRCDVHRERREEEAEALAYDVLLDSEQVDALEVPVIRSIRALGDWIRGSHHWSLNMAPDRAVELVPKLREQGLTVRVRDDAARPVHQVPCPHCLDNPDRFGVVCRPSDWNPLGRGG